MTRSLCIRPARQMGVGVAVALAAAAGFTPAMAEQNPFYVGAGLQYRHFQNINLAQSNGDSDSMWGGSLFGGLDMPIGRQRVWANANIEHSKFQKYSELDGNSHRIAAGFDWATIERLSGIVSAYSAGSLLQVGAPQLAGSSTTTGSITDTTLNTQGYSILARLGGTTRLTFETSYTYDRTRYKGSDTELNAFSDNNRQALALNARYQLSGGLTVGTGVRRSLGEYPDRPLTDERATGVVGPRGDKYKRMDYDLFATYVPSSSSTFDLRLTHTNAKYDSISANNFTGLTGSLEWIYLISGRTKLTTMLMRDTGRDLSLSRAKDRGPILLDDQSRVVTTFRTKVDYALTGKINAWASLEAADRNVVYRSPAGEGKEKSRAYAIGADWEVTRYAMMGCDYVFSDRDRGTGSISSSAYGCKVNVTLR